jgi:hypothetical protein
MHCAADRPGDRHRASRCGRYLAACLASICVLAACSPASTGHSGQVRPGLSAGGRVVVIPGPGGGFLAVPAAPGFNGRPKITLPPIPSAASSQTVSLPLNSYADVSGLQQTVLAEAQSLLTQKCMAARGFVYTSQATPTQEQALLQGIEYGFNVPVARANWLILSLSAASTYGYGQPAAASGPPPGGLFLGGFSSFNALSLDPAMAVALLGFAPGVRIGPVRQQGCLNLANNEIYPPSSNQLGDPAPAIAQQASVWTETDPRVLAVNAAWSRCMAQRGYHYVSPQQPADHNWPTMPTGAETATAVADVTCKQRVNLTNTWLTVEAAYQTALIGQNLATLANLQASFQSALKRVEALLASPALRRHLSHPLGPGAGCDCGVDGLAAAVASR